MKYKKPLYELFSIKIAIIFILAGMPAFTFTACKKAELPEKYLFVSAKSGLVIGDKAGITAAKLAVAPFGEKVKILEDQGETVYLDENYGKWMKVNWKDKTGYAFSGNLTPYDIITFKDFAAKTISDNYKGFIEERKAEFKEISPESRKVIDKIIAKVTNFTSADMDIVSVKGDFMLVEYSGPGYGNLYYLNDWTHSDMKRKTRALFQRMEWWKLARDFADTEKMYFLYLNNDQLPDVVTDNPEGGVVVFIGTTDVIEENGGMDGFKRVQQDGLYGRIDSIERGKLIIKNDEKQFSFDCVKNVFVEKKQN